MDVVSIRPRSYCRGVLLAIRKALAVKAEHPDENVSVLGLLVHNKWVVRALEEKGIKTISEPGLNRLELLDLVPQGYVIFSAHGVSDAVREKAKRLGLKIADATCPEVRSTQELVEQKLAEGYHVFYIGKAGHPEALAVTSGKANLSLITSEEDIPKRLKAEKIFVTNQTTLSVRDLADVFQAITKLYPHAEFANEICSATRKRQEAVEKAGDLDLLLVVGDPQSNNTAMLAEIAKASGAASVKRIESAEDLDLAWFRPDIKVGVTAGASTPAYLYRQVEDYLRTLDFDDPAPLPEVGPAHILDMKGTK